MLFQKGASYRKPSTHPILITGGATLTALLLLRQKSQKPAPSANPQTFTDENLTDRFISAIPEITQELNLELATAVFNETFTRKSEQTTLWGLIDLGTSVVQVQVPVTYRYHLCLRDPWQSRNQSAASDRPCAGGAARACRRPSTPIN